MTSRQGPGGRPKTLLIACGALAREVVELIRLNGWSHMTVTCLPAIWHNRPERIPEAVRGKIRAARPDYDRILVLYSGRLNGEFARGEAGEEEIGVRMVGGT